MLGERLIEGGGSNQRGARPPAALPPNRTALHGERARGALSVEGATGAWAAAVYRVVAAKLQRACVVGARVDAWFVEEKRRGASRSS